LPKEQKALDLRRIEGTNEPGLINVRDAKSWCSSCCYEAIGTDESWSEWRPKTRLKAPGQASHRFSLA